MGNWYTSVANKRKRTNGSENLSEMDENMRIDTAEDSKEKQTEGYPRGGSTARKLFHDGR